MPSNTIKGPRGPGCGWRRRQIEKASIDGRRIVPVASDHRGSISRTRTTSKAFSSISDTIASATAEAHSRPKPTSRSAFYDFVVDMSAAPGETVSTPTPSPQLAVQIPIRESGVFTLPSLDPEVQSLFGPAVRDPAKLGPKDKDSLCRATG